MDFEAEDLKSASLTLAVLLPFSVLLSFTCGAYFYGVIIVRLLYHREKLSSFQKIVFTTAAFSLFYHTISLVNTFVSSSYELMLICKLENEKVSDNELYGVLTLFFMLK